MQLAPSIAFSALEKYISGLIIRLSLKPNYLISDRACYLLAYQPPSQNQIPFLDHAFRFTPRNQPNGKNANTNLFHGNGFGQISWEIYIETLSNCKPVGHQLKRDDVKQPLEAIYRLRNLNLFRLLRGEFGVVGIADDDWATVTSNNCQTPGLAHSVFR